MKADKEKTRDELLRDLAELKKQFAEHEKVRLRSMTPEDELYILGRRIQEQEKKLANEREEYQTTVRDLQMARMIIERSPVILFRRMAGIQDRLEYISENIRMFDYFPEAFLSGIINLRDIVHQDDRQRVTREIREFAEADVEEYTMVYRCVTKDGEVRWVEDQTSVVRNEVGKKTYIQGILYDITERYVAEEEARKSADKYRRIVDTAAEGFYLCDMSLKIVEVNEAYCRMTGYTRDELLGSSLTERATEEFQQFLHFNREKLFSREYREFEGTGITKDGREIPILIHANNVRDDQGEIIGRMAFITDMTVHKEALALAAEVQKSLMPKETPRIPGLDIAGRNICCDEVGGDYYDYIWQRDSIDSPLRVVVGDISGHGVDSALLMTTARAFFRMRALQPGSISEIMSAMNTHLAQDVLDSGRFMTMFCLSIDPLQQCMQWVRAGHEPALLYDPSLDTFQELKGEGVALGVIEEVIYEDYHMNNLQHGQILIIGTDGIWEAVNMQGEMFGKERLKACIRMHFSSNANEILSKVFHELTCFTIGCRKADDITLVIIKFDGSPQYR